MDIELSTEQAELQANVRRFLTKECSLAVVTALEKDPFGYSPKHWAEMARLGWIGLSIPEEYGGSGLKTVDVEIMTREFGRAMFPSPYIPTVLLAGGALAATGSKEQRQRYLPRIAVGEVILGFALQEAGGGYGPRCVAATARASGDGGFVLNGQKRFVEFAAAAERILVVARCEAGGVDGKSGLAMFLVDPKAAGVSLQPLHTMARDRQCNIQLKNVKVAKQDVVGVPGKAWSVLDGVIQRAVVAFSSCMVGAADRSLELGVDYAKQRVQFGQLIGSFQAIQHYLAQMAIDNTAAGVMVDYAAWNLDQGYEVYAGVARAKLCAGDACQAGSEKTAEIYGGMGFVDEVDIAYYMRRGKQWQLSMGDPRFWEEELMAARCASGHRHDQLIGRL